MFVRTFGSADYHHSEYNYSVTEDENGILYFANENGILEYDGNHWQIHPLPDYSHVITLEMGPDGRLYVGGQNEFGYMERDSTGAMLYKSLRTLVDPNHKLGAIWQIAFHKGQAFFQSYEGLVRYDGELATLNPIKNAWYFEIGDELFVSVIEKGIAKVLDDSIKYINTDFKLKNDNLSTPLKGFGQELVLPSEYHGLYLIDTLTMQIRLWDVPVNDELIEHTFYSGEMWNDSTYLFSTLTGGLIWANLKGEIIKTLDNNNGLDASEIRNVHRDTKGNLWIAGTGISHVIWPKNETIPDLKSLIRKLKIDNKNLIINSNRGELITKQCPARAVTFEFSTPGIDKEDVKYSYFLTGFDQEWSEWSDDISKDYTNLECGTYIFHVKALHSNGQESEPATFSLEIPAVWYHTLWAKLGLTMIITLTGFFLYKLRTSRLKSHNQKLEAVIAARTSELQKINEELKTKNEELDGFVHRVSHDLIAPLRSIKGLVSITREAQDLTTQQEAFDHIENSINKQEDFIKSVLEYSINTKQELISEKIDLESICNEIWGELTHYENAEKINFIINITDDFALKSDPQRLKIVMSNLINNAIKYHNLDQRLPTITVSAEMRNNQSYITVEDNGKGIEEHKLPDIFNMFFRAAKGAQGTGLGLYIVSDAVKKLKGDVQVSSQLEKGTTFHLTF